MVRDGMSLSIKEVSAVPDSSPRLCEVLLIPISSPSSCGNEPEEVVNRFSNPVLPLSSSDRDFYHHRVELKDLSHQNHPFNYC